MKRFHRFLAVSALAAMSMVGAGAAKADGLMVSASLGVPFVGIQVATPVRVVARPVVPPPVMVRYVAPRRFHRRPVMVERVCRYEPVHLVRPCPRPYPF